MQELHFDTFDSFLKKFSIDEITLPVGIQRPDTEGNYWLIQVALPMKNLVINCCIFKATTHQIRKYKIQALASYKQAIELKI